MSSVFSALARLRRTRALHPDGLVLRGTLDADGPAVLPLPRGEHEVLVRLSKGAGTPGSLPDVLGLAVRVPLGGDRHWDVLLSTSGGNRVSRMTPLPSTHWEGRCYGSVVPFRRDGDLVWLRAVPQRRTRRIPPNPGALATAARNIPLHFTVEESGRDGEWRAVATLVVRGEAHEDVRFEPVLSLPPGVEMSPRWLGRARVEAYRESRAGAARADGTAARPGAS
ncbi:hypothetical protein [Umezawaea beigongshangensis]|uniref:hypothetical protein n=1 Tax=Umezawaea beigongshangensis TaxID=2780383 RepID=UPI0018F18FBF|nr:hypothetical protein [Umezawaea beigongshangensis]